MLFYKMFIFGNIYLSHSCNSKVTTTTVNYQLPMPSWRMKAKKETSSLLFTLATDPKTYPSCNTLETKGTLN